MKKILLPLVLAAGLTSFAVNAKATILTLSGSLPYSTADASSGSIAIGYDGTNFTFGPYGGSTDNNWTIFRPDFEFGFTMHANPGYGLSSSPVVFGSTIDSTLNYTLDVMPIGGPSFSNAYYGLAYASTGDTGYGWIEVSYDSNAQVSTLVSGGINTIPNQAITAGQTAPVPEPATCALFGIGAIGMLMVIRRKMTV
jgi:PEP-CTERM motif